jgi:hypothetical protein
MICLYHNFIAMNVKITKEEHNRLSTSNFMEYTFGSRLFRTHNMDSDLDLMRVYDYWGVFNENDKYYPNIHSFQYDDEENNIQYLWLTYEQFYKNIYSGDGTMQTDVVLFSGSWSQEEALRLCRTYKVIKAYCGVAKRDLKLHNNPKKIFHADRSLYIAECLMDGDIPDLKVIQYSKELPSTHEYLMKKESELRKRAHGMYERKELHNYNIKPTKDSLLNKMLEANNIREFRY